ncbi:hypothetical protein FQA47_007268 [Oryzias melastigma]|uniref:Uncharacterized protein n=1 Tax=Oryzias melastigma TaxID=30732 RepID=A0A834F859_ORYME|nr:hypothetical protein FQA47_007268 [Oryzias melastigma]
MGCKDGERDERRRSDSTQRYASDYERMSVARQTNKQAGTRVRHREKDDISVRSSWTVTMTEMKRVESVDVPEGKLMKKGSIKKKIESFRRWSSASIKRPPKPKAKTLSLSSPVGDPEDMWLQEGEKRKLRPNC